MSTTITIKQIEAAINVWRERESTPTHGGEALVLGKKARILADVYGLLIFNREETILATELTVEQREALDTGLSIAEWKAARQPESHEPA